MKKSILLILFCAISMSTHAQIMLIHPQDLFLGAVMRGQHNDVQLYLQGGLDINIHYGSRNYDKCALNIAAANNDIKMVKLLMSYDTYPASDNPQENSTKALATAILYGHADIVKIFIEAILAREDADSLDWGYLYASENSKPEIAELFNKTGYMLSDSDRSSTELTEQQIKLYDLKYQKYTANDLQRHMHWYPKSRLREDLFKDKFLYYLKEHYPHEITAHHINAMMNHLMVWDASDIDLSRIQKAVNILEIDISSADPEALSSIAESLDSRFGKRPIGVEILTFWFKNGLNPLLISEESLQPRGQENSLFGIIPIFYKSALFVKKSQGVARRKQNTAEGLALKEQKAAEKEQKAAEKLALKEQEAAEKLALKEQKAAEKIALKEQEAAKKIALKEQKAAEKIALKEQKAAEKAAKKADK